MPAPIATPRIPSGVPGLDEVLQGGLPRGALLLIEGPPGSGKTTFGLQFLLQGMGDGETCLLASSAETLEQLKSIAASHAWNLDGIHLTEFTEPAAGTGEDEGTGYTLFPEAEVDLGETLQRLFAEIERLRPTRLVLDTISVLRILAPTPVFYRKQLRRIRDFMLAQSCTTLMLDEASLLGEKDLRSQTLADGVVDFEMLDFKYGADRRQLRVRKLRGCSYFSGAHDFNIVTGGLVVFPRLVARAHAEIPNFEPLTSGVAQIDGILGGGLPRGSSTLVMGPAGSGKSTLATIYAMAAAKHEHSSILLFDESAESHIARSKGLGLDIAAAIDAGRMRIKHFDPAELSIGEIADLLVRQVEEDNVGLIVIDTLNGYLQSAAGEHAVFLHLRELISYLNRRRVVTILTLTEHGILGSERSTPIDVSFLADNVILLRYFEARGAIRQALSVVKKRTGQHERTIRELTLKPGGISVGEPLEDLTAVLTGTPQDLSQ